MGADSREKHRILIVEDDRSLADGLCRALQNETVEAMSCHTLQEAADLVGTAFSLVLLDVNLPDGSGFDFLVQIKTEYNIAVILLTANDMEMDIVAGLNAGADDYITKPFSLAVLRARVETQLRRMESQTVQTKEPDEAGWIRDGAYRFHFARMIFLHDGEQIELSKGEQKLLRVLVENRGITLTRDQLIDCVWSEDAEFVYENTLSVTIKRLRDKLGAQERIRTVYGIGYRWE